ncbi:hypothetical protein V6N13_128044 [Hibiscus sabdariffa]
MGEISSEMKSVSMENNVVNQNSDEFKRLGLGKQVLAVGQGDHVLGQQQQLHQGDNNNTLLASQEIRLFSRLMELLVTRGCERRRQNLAFDGLMILNLAFDGLMNSMLPLSTFAIVSVALIVSVHFL